MKILKFDENTDILKTPYNIAKKIGDTFSEVGDEYRNEGKNILTEFEIVANYILNNTELRDKIKIKMIDLLGDYLYDCNLEFSSKINQEIKKLKI
jgi:hypothetical protein